MAAIPRTAGALRRPSDAHHSPTGDPPAVRPLTASRRFPTGSLECDPRHSPERSPSGKIGGVEAAADEGAPPARSRKPPTCISGWGFWRYARRLTRRPRSSTVRPWPRAEKDVGPQHAVGASLFPDARRRLVPGSRPAMHLAAHDRRRLDRRPVGQRPRRLFHHVGAASGGLQHRAPGPDLQRHEGRLDLRRDGGDRRRAARRQRVRDRRFGGGENARPRVRRDHVQPPPAVRGRRRNADRAPPAHVRPGQRARARSTCAPGSTPSFCGLRAGTATIRDGRSS